MTSTTKETSSFSNSHLDKKLKMLTMSQGSIQTLSLWCIHHRKHAKKIVHTWLKDLMRAKPKKKLILIYLANDILQNSRKKGPEFNKEFAATLPTVLTHCEQSCDESIIGSITRIMGIWQERNVYSEAVITKFKKYLETSVVPAVEESTTPPIEEDGGKEEDGEFTISEYKRPAVPPDPDELVKRLQELENSATQDAVVREKIANLPGEVTDPTHIDKVDDVESARALQRKLDEACAMLHAYNERLANEQRDRNIARNMLRDYAACQKYELALAEERHEENDAKLKKVTSVKHELQSHLQNLPDMSKLPDPVPLPSAGDLFSIGK